MARQSEDGYRLYYACIVALALFIAVDLVLVTGVDEWS